VASRRRRHSLRALVESLHKVAPEQLTGDSIARIQIAIEAA
jgi:hypothetical protein